MTPPDPTAPSDDLFASLLQSLAEPDPSERAATPPGSTASEAADGGRDTAADLDDALFPSLIIDLSKEPPTAVPADIGDLATDDDAARWGPDAAAPSVVDPVAIADLFPEEEDVRSPAAPLGHFEPHVPWWEKRRIQAAIGIGAVALLVLGGLALAMRGSDDETTDDVTTDTLPDSSTRNPDAAITTTVPERGPSPSGLPVAPTEGSTGKTTTTTAKPSTSTTRRPSTTPAPPPSAPSPGTGTEVEPEAPTTTEAPPEPPPVDPNVEWGRSMQARTALGEWVGFFQLGNDESSRREARLGMRFDEASGVVVADIFVPSAREYDLTGVTVSIVPGAEATSNTPFGPVATTTNAFRVIDTLARDTNRGTITGPFRSNGVRLVVDAVDDQGFPVFGGVYEFS